MHPTPPGDASSARLRSPFDELVGTELVETSGERVVARLTVDERLHQVSGIVHGGVYATLAESVTGLGATLALDGAGVAVGLGNHTEFLRPVSAGQLTVVGESVQHSRSLQLWGVTVTDERQRTVATATVRLFNRYHDRE